MSLLGFGPMADAALADENAGVATLDTAGSAVIDFGTSAVLDAVFDSAASAVIDIAAVGVLDAIGQITGQAEMDVASELRSSFSVIVPPSPGGIGRAAWRDHSEPFYRKRKKDLEDANRALLALRAKINEQEISRKAELERAKVSGWVQGLQSAEIFLANAASEQQARQRLEAQLAFVQNALQEMDDEEAIVLLLN